MIELMPRAPGGFLRQIVRRAGFDIIRFPPPSRVTDHELSLTQRDFDDDKRRIVEGVVGTYTQLSPERVGNMVDAVRFAVRANIPGAVVECGVWRGGAMMAAAQALMAVSDATRELWLYDTFEGMPDPSPHDVFIEGNPAQEILKSGDNFAALADVQRNMDTTGYPTDLITYVKGKVEDTIPSRIPASVAVLRLDTDWYESTRHELENLYSLVSPGGVVIIDDYGSWRGSQKAVDEFMSSLERPMYLARIDYTGRVFTKPW